MKYVAFKRLVNNCFKTTWKHVSITVSFQCSYYDFSFDIKLQVTKH